MQKRYTMCSITNAITLFVIDLNKNWQSEEILLNNKDIPILAK